MKHYPEVTFEDVKKGDMVIRMLGGEIPMKLYVKAVTEDLIDCGWTFDRLTGAEVDEEMGWGPLRTGSYLVKE